ncbi:MAG: hypothetical protein ABIR46_01980 [Candidatus Saccharimonadales bacterium]
MDQFQEQSSSLNRLVKNENDYLDIRQKGHKHNVFRNKSLAENTPERHTVLDQFMDELSTKTSMISRYELFMDERYADEVYTLDLDETKEPGSHDAVEQLKAEYIELRQQLMGDEVIDDELPRSESKRTIHFNNSLSPDHYLGTRNRVLFCFERGDRKITVAKRMTFLIDKSALPGGFISESNNGQKYLSLVQKKIDRQDEAITPVRTVYYVTNKPIVR